MEFTQRFNVRIKDVDEAASVAATLVFGNVECEELKKAATDEKTKFPIWVAVEGNAARVLGGKPSGTCYSAANICAAVAGFFFGQYSGEVGKHLETIRRNLRFTALMLAASVIYLAIELYDLYRIIHG